MESECIQQPNEDKSLPVKNEWVCHLNIFIADKYAVIFHVIVGKNEHLNTGYLIILDLSFPFL